MTQYPKSVSVAVEVEVSNHHNLFRNHRIDWFTIGVLYSLDGKWRGTGNDLSFERIYTEGILHRAWDNIKKCDPRGSRDFFREFMFAVNGRYILLDEIIRFACTYRQCIRIDGNGKYHLDEIDVETLKSILSQHNISVTLVTDTAQKLNRILESLSPTIH